MRLEQLKEWYIRYQDFWPQWKDYPYNGLSSYDIVAIEVIRGNNFKINTVMLEKFRNKVQISEEFVRSIIAKLQANYSEYKEWVSLRFQLSLVKYATICGIDKFFNSPIDLLPVSQDFKKALKIFNCESIHDISIKYTDKDYTNEPTFTNVLKFKEFITDAPKTEIFAFDEILFVT